MLWPIHLRPLADELLSCWIVRLGYAHNLKLRTFARLLSPDDPEIWYRDIDRDAPQSLLSELSKHTGVPLAKLESATLRAYEGRIYRVSKESGILRWILPLQVWEWQHQGFGLQFCPKCLADDRIPYYRKRWRVAFYTWCSRHNVMVHDRCPQCGAAVSFHRRDLNVESPAKIGEITLCSECDFDFREAECRVPVFYEPSSTEAFELAIRRLEGRGQWCKPRGVRYYNVLHQLCRLTVTHYRNVALGKYVEERVRAPHLQLPPTDCLLEQRSVDERHHILQLGFWVLADLEERLTAAWNAEAITRSALLRDFDDYSKQYAIVAQRFHNWRTRNGN